MPPEYEHGNVNELRQDLVTGRWVIISTSRGKRPQEFRINEKIPPTPIADCPFEDPEGNGINGSAFRAYSKNGERTEKPDRSWVVQVIPNKFPILEDHDGICAEKITHGEYTSMPAIGRHEVIITRDHESDIADLPVEIDAILVRAWRDRMRDIAEDKCIAYILVFQNHGKEAGASVQHPHSQLIALPVVPPSVERSLAGSLEYQQTHNTCVHCAIIANEQKEGLRVIAETTGFIVLTPYAPHAPFEVRIFPKHHVHDFRTLTTMDIEELADVLKRALQMITVAIGHFSYNLFIHTSPVSAGDHSHYHWHVEILPKSSTHAGVEFGTGVLVLSVAPEDAAAHFKSKWR